MDKRKDLRMITENTLFILGAGASVPYGFPTGRQLRRIICREFLEHYKHLIGYKGGTHDKYDEVQIAGHFANTFSRSNTPSIDLFLARNQDFSEIGKKAIALSIWRSEINSNFGEDVDQEQDWYTYLFERMTEQFTNPHDYNRISKNDISFITFNYDRSLEYFLYDSIINSFTKIPRTRPPSDEFFPFKVHHVYGKLAELPWQNNQYSLEYKPKLSLPIFNTIYENIRVIYDRTDNNIKHLKEEISKAKKIFFLGFGFAKENLDVLSIPELLTGKQQIYGTAFGMTDKERAGIRKTFMKNVKIKDTRMINPVIQDTNCYKLLREYL